MSRSCRPGFTLLEVLLAVVILGVLLTTVYGAVSRTLRSKEIADDRGELFAAGREVVMRLGEEIEGALHPQLGNRFFLKGTPGGGEPPADTIEFVAMNRGGYGSNRMRPGHMLVSYSIETVGDRRDLFRLRVDRQLWECLLAEVDGDTEVCDVLEDYEKYEAYYLLDCLDLAGELKIAGNCIRVVGLRFQYYDDAFGSFRDEWDSFHEPTDGRLPAAVRISLFLADERGVIHPFTTVVDVPLARGQPTPRPGGEDDDADDEDVGEDGGEG